MSVSSWRTLQGLTLSLSCCTLQQSVLRSTGCITSSYNKVPQFNVTASGGKKILPDTSKTPAVHWHNWVLLMHQTVHQWWILVSILLIIYSLLLTVVSTRSSCLDHNREMTIQITWICNLSWESCTELVEQLVQSSKSQPNPSCTPFDNSVAVTLITAGRFPFQSSHFSIVRSEIFQNVLPDVEQQG